MTSIKYSYCLIIVLSMNRAEGDDFQLMDDLDFSLEETDTLLFEIKSCSTAHLLLMNNKADFQTQLYEIEIGGINGSEYIIRKDKSGTIVANSNFEYLECNTWRTYWALWNQTTLLLGNGLVAGKYTMIAYHDNKLLEINHVSVSAGYWIFYRSNCGCCSHEPRYCQSLQDTGVTESGAYNVTGVDSGGMTEVYCDMETDGGGWLVFQRRQDGSEDFYRGWDDYENGFGDLSGEFWLGNRRLSTIISHGHYELRIDLEDWEGNKRYAKYHTFIIGNSCDNYKLTVFGYSGDAGNSLELHSGIGFSTMNRDNDKLIKNNCAKLFQGAWWYTACNTSNLNGLYLRGNHSSYANGVNWRHWKGNNYSLKITEMKVREICKL